MKWKNKRLFLEQQVENMHPHESQVFFLKLYLFIYLFIYLSIYF